MYIRCKELVIIFYISFDAVRRDFFSNLENSLKDNVINYIDTITCNTIYTQNLLSHIFIIHRDLSNNFTKRNYSRWHNLLIFNLHNLHEKLSFLFFLFKIFFAQKSFPLAREKKKRQI